MFDRSIITSMLSSEITACMSGVAKVKRPDRSPPMQVMTKTKLSLFPPDITKYRSSHNQFSSHPTTIFSFIYLDGFNLGLGQHGVAVTVGKIGIVKELP